MKRKARKGDIVAFETILIPRRGESYWRLGVVLQATRPGRVRFIDCEGAKIPMLQHGQQVGDVLFIPTDQVYRDELLQSTVECAWPSEAAITAHVARYLREKD